MLHDNSVVSVRLAPTRPPRQCYPAIMKCDHGLFFSDTCCPMPAGPNGPATDAGRSAMNLCVTRLASFAVLALYCLNVFADEPRVDYSRDVKPILKSRCFGCHGALKQEAGLRLDTGKLIRKGGDDGAVLVVGDVRDSDIVNRITAADDSERMPPEGKPLTAEQIQIIKTWIQQGATSPSDEKPEEDPREHWAFKKPVRSAIPLVKNRQWVRNPIDAFIAAEHERRGLTPLPPANKNILLRRVYLDLIGLPPTRDELHSFLADDSPDAYENVVEQLLESRHYGERWGRHWMDVWRYSDWYGRRQVNDVRNSYPHIWRWRDWIIESLNHDKGYDQMIREMLAADELYPDDDSRIPAMGFIVRNWFSLNYDTWKSDLVEHTSKAFLGLRLNCAHCHDHKYDPITQEEYFKFRAFFEPIELRHDRVPSGPALTKYIRYKPGSGGSLKPIVAGLARIYDHRPNAETFMYRLGDTRDRMDRPTVAPGAPAILGGDKLEIEPVELPPVAWYPGLKPFAQQAEIDQCASAVKLAETALAKVRTDTDELKAQLASAEQELAEAQQKHHKQSATTKISLPEKQVIGYWRFEGADGETGFLSDSSGNGHRLSRVTGSDPAAAPFSLKPKQRGQAFFNPIPATQAANSQAVDFQQNRSFAYLATAGSPDFYANTFTIEAYVHFDVSQRNYNRTIADYEGCWTLLHRGLDDKTFELRLRYFNQNGELRDVATGTGDNRLILTTGQDHYFCLVMGKKQATFHAVNLTAGGVLQSVSFPRNADDKDFSTLARPKNSTSVKIGNSDGTGRVDGLIDEVRYTRGALTPNQIAMATGQSTDALVRQAAAHVATVTKKLASVPGRIKAQESQLNHAKVELAAIRARVAADNARYKTHQETAADLTAQAVVAERAAKLAAAHAKLALTEQTLVDLGADGKADAKKIKQAESGAAAARKAIAAAGKEDEKTEYTPFGPQYPKTSTGRRRALANWIASTDNPMTARVAINHIWMRHFGQPLVKTVFDLGRSGDKPTHPKLLDWLAVELMNAGPAPASAPKKTTGNKWRMKHIHRLIVTSSTYRTSSRHGILNHPNTKIDRDNTYWWKFNRQRMQAEVVRDSMLLVSGRLDRTFGGQEIDPKLENESRRRSIYFSVYPEAGGTMPFMTMFDSANPCDCYRRTESIVPQQALAMSNSSLALTLGRQLATRLPASITKDNGNVQETEFIVVAFESILSRTPTLAEQKMCEEFLSKQRTIFSKAKTNSLKAQPAKGVTPASSEPAPRARESLVRVLLNHNDFITIH